MNTKLGTRGISIGVIGMGGMGTRHAVNLHRFVGGARIAGVYDKDKGHAVQAAKQCGNVEVFEDPIELINHKSVDAILIASPDDTHAEFTFACLKADKPVLCEKPLATRVEDAQRVMDAEVAIGRKLISVGFMRRFDPQHAAVKNISMSGDLGRPLLWKGVHRNASVAFGITGDTILTNSAGHDFDSARFLLGEEVESVYVRGLRSRPELHQDTKDLLLIEMFMTNNTMATAEVFVNDDYGYEVSAELVCQRGTAVTQQADKAMVRAKAHRGFTVPSDWLSPFQEAYVAEAIEWVESLQNNRPFKGACAWDGYVTMMITAACIKSLHSGQVVSLSLSEKSALYK